MSKETKEKISKAHVDMKYDKTRNKNVSKALKGRKLTQKHKDNIAEAMKGEGNHQWKGGVSKLNHRLRTNIRFKKWREEVFERDDWTCQDCGERGCELHPHHILPLAEHPEFAYDIDNGITLCVPCHRKIHGYKSKFNKKR